MAPRSSVAAVLAAGVLLVQPPPVTDYAAIYSNNESATVFVAAEGTLFNGTKEQMTGTGFFISESGLVLTNNHVTFANKANYQAIAVAVHVKSRKAVPMTATIEWSDAANDLAVLRVSAPLKSFRRVALGAPSAATPGSRIAVMGFPLASDLSIVEGLISSRPLPNRWQTSAPLNPGNSGGPVFNVQGEVIGVVSSGTVSASVSGLGTIDVDGINYFIPIDVMTRQSASITGSLAKDIQIWASVDQPQSAKPANLPKVNRLARDFTVSQGKDDHPSLLPDRRSYSSVFEAEPGYRIVNARLESLSANFVSDLVARISENGARVEVAYTLQSGPLFDRYRAWLHATLHTEQIRN